MGGGARVRKFRAGVRKFRARVRHARGGALPRVQCKAHMASWYHMEDAWGMLLTSGHAAPGIAALASDFLAASVIWLTSEVLLWEMVLSTQ